MEVQVCRNTGPLGGLSSIILNVRRITEKKQVYLIKKELKI